jgi:CDP-diacylglycerol--glycerol-3-phosphate 3-phosphatidyltransferase
MIANIITVARIILVFIVIGLFQIPNAYTRMTAAVLVIVVIYLDSLDGYLARKLGVASDFGALFDITGDRIVENVFWIYYSTIGLVTIWVPLIVISRSFIVDAVRAVAFRKGKTPFGKNTMMKSKITKFMVASPFSRSLYGALKIIIFTLLGVLLALQTGIIKSGWEINIYYIKSLKWTLDFLISATLVVCILRGLPVLWDGKEILFEKNYPKDIEIG